MVSGLSQQRAGPDRGKVRLRQHCAPEWPPPPTVSHWLGLTTQVQPKLQPPHPAHYCRAHTRVGCVRAIDAARLGIVGRESSGVCCCCSRYLRRADGQSVAGGRSAQCTRVTALPRRGEVSDTQHSSAVCSVQCAVQCAVCEEMTASPVRDLFVSSCREST